MRISTTYIEPICLLFISSGDGGGSSYLGISNAECFVLYSHCAESIQSIFILLRAQF